MQNKIRIYECKKCKKFRGIRPHVRKHIREEHLEKIDIGKYMSSEEFK